MAKIANYEIEKHISTLTPFINYNSSIVATCENGLYRVWHWETQILTYNINTGVIDHLYSHNRSQTTSTLVGRIVRSLPRPAVVQFLVEAKSLSKYDRTRIVKMARL
jgi:hypothetical protein